MMLLLLLSLHRAAVGVDNFQEFDVLVFSTLFLLEFALSRKQLVYDVDIICR